MKNYEPVKKQLNERNIDDNKIICIEKNEVFEKIETFASSEKYDGTKIKAFYNIHRDERCFIIGNGPSLLIEDLKKIQSMHDASFACNMIFNCFDKTVWRPDYYFMIDYIGLREVFGNIDGVDKIKYVSNNCRQIFTRYGSEMDKFKDIVNNINYLNLIFPETLDNFMFSEDCSLYIYMGYTVSYIMIQLAVYMGFKEIFLLGMDHSYSKFTGTEDDGKKKDHADFLGKYNLWGNPDTVLDQSTLAYISAKKYADEHGIKIFNATRGGKLEVFPRVDFDALF